MEDNDNVNKCHKCGVDNPDPFTLLCEACSALYEGDQVVFPAKEWDDNMAYGVYSEM
jgi:hypothetical protein